jgi:hypothetical protein
MRALVWSPLSAGKRVPAGPPLDGKVTYVQFLEDMLQSTTSFKVDGPFGTYIVDPETKKEIHA